MMNQLSLKHRIAIAFLGLSAPLLPFGCDYYFIDPDDLDSIPVCETDEDLRKEGRIWEGAVCVDGKAKCPDGRTPCDYISTFESKGKRVLGCLQECIECPVGTLICYYRKQPGDIVSYYCGTDPSECFGDDDYKFLPNSLADCPTMAKDCLDKRP